MSINNTWSYGTKARNLGEVFNTIDFELNPALTSEAVKHRATQTIVGNLTIGNRTTKLNLKEIDKIIETLESAKDVYFKKYKLNIFR
jgi:hypothetical protein